MWMNEYEVEDTMTSLSGRSDEMPIAFELAQILDRLVSWTNSHSDGWPYWRKPSQAAGHLMQILSNARDGEVDVTVTDRAFALRPIKAFLTRQTGAGNATHADRLWVLEGKRPEDVI